MKNNEAPIRGISQINQPPFDVPHDPHFDRLEHLSSTGFVMHHPKDASDDLIHQDHQ